MPLMTEERKIDACSARKQRAALASTAASVLLTLAKLAAGALSGSLALLSEGAHNALDIGVSALTYFAIREADKPADEDHPFGHAKIEAVAALAQTGFLLALAVWVAFTALQRLGGEGAEVNANLFAFAAIVAFARRRSRALARAAARRGGDGQRCARGRCAAFFERPRLLPAGADGAHRDHYGYAHADAIAAVGVALFIAAAGYRLGRRTIDALVDAAPKGLATKTRDAVEAVPGVAGRLPAPSPQRPAHRRRSRPVRLAHAAARTRRLDQVRCHAALARRWPAMQLTITANPLALDDESLLERVQVIASRRRLFVHHVESSASKGAPASRSTSRSTGA